MLMPVGAQPACQQLRDRSGGRPRTRVTYKHAWCTPTDGGQGRAPLLHQPAGQPDTSPTRGRTGAAEPTGGRAAAAGRPRPVRAFKLARTSGDQRTRRVHSRADVRAVHRLFF
jgi:hypothetical protein